MSDEHIHLLSVYIVRRNHSKEYEWMENVRRRPKGNATKPRYDFNLLGFSSISCARIIISHKANSLNFEKNIVIKTTRA